MMLIAFWSPNGVSDRITMSSAKESVLSLCPSSVIGWQELLKESWMSLINKLNSSGLRLHPCLTPNVLLNDVEYFPLDLILYVISEYIDCSSCKMFPLMPYCPNL